MGQLPSIDSAPRIGVLLEVSRQLGGLVEFTPLLERIASAACRVLNCDRSTVFLYDANSHELFSQVATGEKEIRFSADLGIAGEAARTGQIINVPDAYEDERFNPDIDRRTGYRTRNLLTFPLQDHESRLVGVLQVLNKNGGAFDSDDEQVASVLSSLAGVAIQRQRLIEEHAEKKKLERDLALAREIQQSLLPRETPRVPGFDIAGFNRPADATGGDCYDFIPLPGGGAALMVADATGHGIGPALLVSQYRTMLRSLMRMSTDPRTLLELANEQLCDDVPPGMFVTTFFGKLDSNTGAMDFYSAGQGPLLNFRAADDSAEQLGSHTIPLGIIAPLPPEPSEPLLLEPGDMFVVLTDGFFEAINESGKQFGVDRVVEILRENKNATAEQIIDCMNTALGEFIGDAPQTDDLTAVIIRRTSTK